MLMGFRLIQGDWRLWLSLVVRVRWSTNLRIRGIPELQMVLMLVTQDASDIWNLTGNIEDWVWFRMELWARRVMVVLSMSSYVFLNNTDLWNVGGSYRGFGDLKLLLVVLWDVNERKKNGVSAVCVVECCSCVWNWIDDGLIWSSNKMRRNWSQGSWCYEFVMDSGFEMKLMKVLVGLLHDKSHSGCNMKVLETMVLGRIQ